ncbi:GNAT family N-acetyltransferase [Capnocytophaga gingivalis]|uniref:GNAT family N-acetyltransferase n=1 Tax=Capnocytophaga gingivalis TaxID=1017 RepID=UPI0028D5E44C|nr:GNAT family N-acetyltransferase [Capnocytophaga gingivalis]
MRITEGLLPEDKEAIIHWTNSKGADFLQQWAGDALLYPLTIEALNALPHCFRIETEGSFIGMIQQIRVEGSNVHIGRFLINPSLTRKGLGTSAMQLFIAMLFEDKSVHSISLNVFDDNPIAKGLYTKLGFEVVATIEGERKKYKMMKSNSVIN